MRGFTFVDRLKKLPWLAFVLLFLSNLSFGWFLAGFTRWRFLGLIGVAVIFILAFMLTPLSNSRRYRLLQWLTATDSVLFSTILLGVIVGILLFMVRLFAHTAILILSTALTRLELHAIRFSSSQSLLILTANSVTGFLVGWYSYPYFASPAFPPTLR